MRISSGRRRSSEPVALSWRLLRRRLPSQFIDWLKSLTFAAPMKGRPAHSGCSAPSSVRITPQMVTSMGEQIHVHWIRLSKACSAAPGDAGVVLSPLTRNWWSPGATAAGARGDSCCIGAGGRSPNLGGGTATYNFTGRARGCGTGGQDFAVPRATAAARQAASKVSQVQRV